MCIRPTAVSGCLGKARSQQPVQRMMLSVRDGCRWTDAFGDYVNGEPGQPLLASLLLYLDDQWPRDWGAETLFLDDEVGAACFLGASRGVLLSRQACLGVLAEARVPELLRPYGLAPALPCKQGPFAHEAGLMRCTEETLLASGSGRFVRTQLACRRG